MSDHTGDDVNIFYAQRKYMLARLTPEQLEKVDREYKRSLTLAEIEEIIKEQECSKTRKY